MKFTVTLEILKRNADILNDSSNDGDDYDGPLVINFKGMIVGNPYVDPYTNTVAQLQTLYTHGIIPKYPTYQNWIDHCSHDPTKYIKKGVSFQLMIFMLAFVWRSFC